MPFCNLKKKQPFLTVQFHIFGFSSFSLWGSASPEIFELNTVLSSFNKGICCSHTCFNFSTSLPISCLMATCLPSVSGHSYCFWLLGFPEVLWLDLFFFCYGFSPRRLSSFSSGYSNYILTSKVLWTSLQCF